MHHGPDAEPTAAQASAGPALERCDRNLVELLQEVRVAQTGVHVLFAFLLRCRSPSASTTSRTPSAPSISSRCGAAAVLLIAPTSHHRLLFRCGDKERLVMVANRYAIAGHVAVAASMVGALPMVSLLVIGALGAALASAAAAAGCAWCWYLEPLRRRRTLARASSSPAPAGDPRGSSPRAPVRAAASLSAAAGERGR
jgi:hypothetical protein